MSDAPASRSRPFGRPLPSVDRPVIIAFACLVLLMGLGSLYSKAFLSADFLGQEVQRASYVGVVALGQMTVILLGRIDLSVPWTLTTAAMMATAVGGTAAGAPFAVPAGLAAGLAVGLVNGLGIALLRVPSMIFTLGINSVLFGLMTIYTGGGFAPSDNATPLMSWLGVGRGPLGVPIPVIVWAILAVAVSFLLRRTVFGRAVYGIGNSEAAAYLSGIDTRLVIIGAFVLSGLCAGLAGVLLAGYAGKAAQAMGDEFLLPSIAAVVLGGTNVLGGRGTTLGTVAGALLITFLVGMLTVAQMPEGGRLIIYCFVILGMLLIYGRGKRHRA